MTDRLADHRRCVDSGSPCGEDCAVWEVEAAEQATGRSRMTKWLDGYIADVLEGRSS